MNTDNIRKIKEEIERLSVMYQNSIQFRDWMSCDLISDEIDILESKLKDLRP